MDPAVTVTHRGEERLRAGHPWVYRSDVADARADPGDTVRVLGTRGRPLGYALFSSQSEIAIRLLTRDVDAERPGLDWWRARLASALAYRGELGIDATAYRIVHAEADGLPSLVVDRYGDYLVVQTLSQGTDRLRPQIATLLQDLLQPAGILARNDPRVRELEGLDRKVELLHGEVPERVTVREGSVEHEVDLWRGQKTGLFLDQRENRQAAAGYTRGRALDCFSYHGGFALALARRAADVVALEISADAVARARANAARNGLANVSARDGQRVRRAARARSRATSGSTRSCSIRPRSRRTRRSVPAARRGYKEINLRALKLLNPGGYLVTCSCSYNVDEALFGEILCEAAVDARATVAVVEKRMQSRDHPVLIGVPETYYLKCFIARKLA